MIHMTTIPMWPPPGKGLALDRMREQVVIAIVSLYRRSQMAGEEGRLFILKRPDPVTNQLEIGLLRTNDETQIAAARLFNAMHELDDDQILELFK